MKDDNKLTIVTKDGKTIKYDVITTFYWFKTDKNYIIYTDNTKNEMKQLNIHASIFNPKDLSKLDEITTDEEWQLIEDVLNEIKNRGDKNERNI